MAPRDASRIQLDFPQLTADIISQLRLTGVVGLMEFLDAVRPVYIVAAREGALDITVSPPVFASVEIFSEEVIDPAINTIFADSGPLPAGDYDVFSMISYAGGGTIARGSFFMQHMNAANTITLSTLLTLSFTTISHTATIALAPLRYTLALNERLRYFSAAALTGAVSAVIAAALVPTP